ncbi:MAG: extracellular solute-binding protein, partial [Lachnospiraceae bacterium]|nr:extracellular solute-binding protein [Lachnospiraceae bacterium]
MKIKNIIYIILSLVLLLLSSCKKDDGKEKLYVYNWGIYLDETVVDRFEKKYNCDVIYDTYDTNEEMYAVVKEEARVYDVLCPTDYMVEKMIKKDLLYSYDIKELPNYKNIDKRILDIMKSFDKDNVYAIPYVHSTLGLIYNKSELDRMGLPYPKKWADLWNEEYKGEILLQDAMRDLLMVGLKKNNFSMNSLSQDELDIATGDLIKQKHLVNAYLIDPLRDKMVAGDGTIASMYSGEVEYIKSEGSKYQYEYILPEEGVNFTMDVWVIP